jgi:ABC-2 type transport system permease protein
MPAGAYIFGKVVASMAFAAAIVALLAVCGTALAGLRLATGQWVLLFVILVAGTAPFCAIGLALGYLAGPNSAPAIVNLVHLPATLASGLWIPVFMLPGFMQAIAQWLPHYHLGQLALTVVGAPSDPDTTTHLANLAAWTVAAVIAAAWAYRRDEGRLYG